MNILLLNNEMYNTSRMHNNKRILIQYLFIYLLYLKMMKKEKKWEEKNIYSISFFIILRQWTLEEEHPAPSCYFLYCCCLPMAVSVVSKGSLYKINQWLRMLNAKLKVFRKLPVVVWPDYIVSFVFVMQHLDQFGFNM